MSAPTGGAGDAVDGGGWADPGAAGELSEAVLATTAVTTNRGDRNPEDAILARYSIGAEANGPI